MEKKKLSEEEVKFNNEIKKIVLDILEKNKKPMIKISLSDDKPTLFQSKFGGVPYLPKNVEVPKNKENQQLTLLAQINIEELPKNNIYPMKEGILQFWILNDDVLGLDYDPHLGDGFKIIYYKEIDKSVTEEEVLEKYKPYKDEDSYFPIEGEFSLSFKLTDGYFSDSNDDFREIVDREMKKFHDENKDKYSDILKIYDKENQLNYWEIWDILEEDKEIGERLFGAGHKIGGFPNFTQSDIREVGDYEILLLQIDSEGTEKNEIMWGDCGIANFFIREKDLKKLNFDRAIYNWDCC
ncbi:YwqG family protein [Fusobacterium sp.]|uniref:YwqG family protein n=1 Tax=Fusobacterium sp. TaxID=68766 RepID=UPI00262CA1BC|nr:YwqG family protein [Fusobacterium sp.]MDY3058480.1 YwqG family protein [Fusobacterium sp.]